MGNNGKPVKRPNGKAYRRYPKETWEKIKAEYESSMVDCPELADKWKVSVKSIYKHIKDDKWVKGKNLPVIYASIAEKNRASLVKAGVTDEIAMKLLARGMLEPIVVVFEGKGEAMQANTVPDYKTRLEYLKERNKLVKAYPETVEKDGDKHVHFHMDAEKLKNKSADDVISDYQRLISWE